MFHSRYSFEINGSYYIFKGKLNYNLSYIFFKIPFGKKKQIIHKSLHFRNSIFHFMKFNVMHKNIMLTL